MKNRSQINLSDSDFLFSQAQESKSGEKGLVKLVREEHTGVAGLKPFKKDEKAPFGHPYYWSPFILIGNWR